MALSMARPWQHPETGTFYLRQRVPQDVLTRAKGQRLTLAIGEQAAAITIGKIVQASLRTKDRAVAKIRHAEADAALKRFWSAVRNGPVSLTQKEIVMLAGLAYRATVRALEDDRSRFILQVVETADDAGLQLNGGVTFESARAEFVSLLEAQGTPAAWAHYEDPREAPLPLLEAGFGLQADALLQQQGLRVDDASRALLLREIYRAMREAAGHLERNARGDFRPDPAADRYPAFEAPKPAANGPKAPLSVEALFALWHEKRKGAATGTKKRYASSFRSLAAFVGERDVSTLTGDDIYAWAEHRLDADRVSARSINRCDIANVKAVFAWGTTRPAGSVIAHNPATNIRLEETRHPKVRERTFRHGEVVAILHLASNHELKPAYPKLSAARRWCPWLAAYSGARISELTALRRGDVRCEAGVWVMTLNATKTNEIRTVPLHAHLVELGFLDFVERSARGALFFDEGRKRKGSGTSEAEVVSKDIARWIRQETRLDPNVDPNHGWRHTWKTRASGCRIPEREMDAIVGHGPGSVARKYIAPPLEDLTKAIRAFPRYTIDHTSSAEN
ncbi:DUF6538 domain-containing protein [Methylobacterium sp. DCY52]|uniref:DUF6538 domain-containing protein n=1 Tax=Methylobacterium sp. DCY52 TaxID=739139 RepID=UPI00314526B9